MGGINCQPGSKRVNPDHPCHVPDANSPYPSGDIEVVMEHGQSFHFREAIISSMGRRELSPDQNNDGARRLAGVQIVCAPDTDVVIAV